jgi:DNA-directed RNA polymerase specialized sigma24 family protein
MKIEDLLRDSDVIKIAESAASSFRHALSEDEIKNCIYNAVWKASRNYSDEGNAKFTSYLYKGVIFECLGQKRFNQDRGFSLSRYDNSKNKCLSYKCKDFSHIDMMDEISQCDDPMLIYDRFYSNMTIGELAKQHGVCGETIRIRIEKNLKKIKNSLTGS